MEDVQWRKRKIIGFIVGGAFAVNSVKFFDFQSSGEVEESWIFMVVNSIYYYSVH